MPNREIFLIIEFVEEKNMEGTKEEDFGSTMEQEIEMEEETSIFEIICNDDILSIIFGYVDVRDLANVAA